MNRDTCAATRIALVDAQPWDYVPLLSAWGVAQYEFRFFPTGRAAFCALRTAECSPLWLINVRLPDYSGFDLAEMILSDAPRATIFLVDEEFDPDHELRALRLGVAMYVAKPPDPSWLDSFRPVPSS